MKLVFQILGSGYKKVPLVLGATLKKAFEATVTANWDAVNQNISTVTVSSKKVKIF